jgi:CelD/BcsL family acetyltransferase involved in cellulose biosynthesis
LDDLFHATNAPLTARRPWLACWARHHREWLPWLILVQGSEGLDAAALLARRETCGVVQVAMLGQGQSDYACLPARGVRDTVRLADAVAGTLRRLRKPWMVHLQQLPAGDPVVTALAERLRWCMVQPGDPSPIIRFSPGTDLRTRVRKNARSITRRAVNRLAREQIRLTVEQYHDKETVQSILPEIATVRAARDRDKGRQSDHLHPATRGFWYEVLPLLAGRGELEVTTVRLDGRLGAYAVALLDPPAYRSWDTRIAPELKDFAPGHLLRSALLEQLYINPRWSEFDTMRGVEAYKNAIADELRETVDLRAWSSPVIRLPWRARRAAAVLRDRHPTLVHLDQVTRRALARVRERARADR